MNCVEKRVHRPLSLERPACKLALGWHLETWMVNMSLYWNKAFPKREEGGLVLRSFTQIVWFMMNTSSPSRRPELQCKLLRLPTFHTCCHNLLLGTECTCVIPPGDDFGNLFPPDSALCALLFVGFCLCTFAGPNHGCEYTESYRASLVAQMERFCLKLGIPVPRVGRSPGERDGNPLQYSCLRNPMDRGTWWAIVHRVSKNRTLLSD